MQLKPHIICGRSTDTPLTELGRRQALLLGRRLKQEGANFDEWWTSPAVRACDTMSIARQELGITGQDANIFMSEALHELHKGDWDGKARALLPKHILIRAREEGLIFLFRPVSLYVKLVNVL